MHKLHRAILLFEAIICFGPVTYMWLLSLIGVPLLLVAFINGGGLESLTVPALTIFGGLGLFGAAALLISLGEAEPSISARKLKVYFGSGCIASMMGIAFFGINEPYSWALFLLPVAANLHWIYLGRSFFKLTANTRLQADASRR